MASRVVRYPDVSKGVVYNLFAFHQILHSYQWEVNNMKSEELPQTIYLGSDS